MTTTLKPWPRQRAHTRRGFTLFELMLVAGLLGIFVTAVSDVMRIQQASYNYNQNLIDTQRNLRVAQISLETDLRLAGEGMVGCFEDTGAGAIYDGIYVSTNIATTSGYYRGIIPENSSVSHDTVTAIYADPYIRGFITNKYAGDEKTVCYAGGTTTIPAVGISVETDTVNKCPSPTALCQGDYILVWDGSYSELLQVTSIASGGNVTYPPGPQTNSPKRVLPFLNIAANASSNQNLAANHDRLTRVVSGGNVLPCDQLYKYVAKARIAKYTVATVGGKPTLRQMTYEANGPVTRDIAENVEVFQLTYGFDTSTLPAYSAAGKGFLNDTTGVYGPRHRATFPFASFGAQSPWRIRAVEYSLIARSPRLEYLSDGTNTRRRSNRYANAQSSLVSSGSLGDLVLSGTETGHLRRVITGTVDLINTGRSENSTGCRADILRNWDN